MLEKPGLISNLWDRTISHTFLVDNHVRLHSSQNASYTGDVCDMQLRLTAKPHLCVICGTFHTEVNTSAFLEVKLRPLIDYINWYSFVVPGNYKLRPLIDYLLRWVAWKYEEKWRVYGILISFHSERYEKNITICLKDETGLSQHTLLGSINISLVSLRSLGTYFLIQVTSAEIILSHLECIW